MNTSIQVGPSVISDGLIAFYDTASVRSYRGEPTENLVTNQNSHSSAGAGAVYAIEEVTTGPWKGWNKIIATRTRDSGALVCRLPSLNCEPDIDYTFSIEYVSTNSNLVFQVTGQNSFGSFLPHLGGNRYARTFRRESTSGAQSLFLRWNGGGVDIPDAVVYYRNIQYEEKPHATPFTLTSRPASNGLKNLMSNNLHFDLDNISFNENGMFFDGVDDVITRTGFSSLVGNDWTFGGWVKFLSSSSENQIYMSYSLPYLMMVSPSGVPRLSWRDEGGTQRTLTASSQYALEMNKWYYIIGTHNGVNTARLYINGENVAESSNYIGSWSIGTNLRLGAHGSAYYSHCEQNSIQVYNRALTPDEIKLNYENTKSRYIN